MTTDTADIQTNPHVKSMNIQGAIVGLASVICTFTFMIVLMLCIFAREHVMVAAYIAGAYFFTSSTSFANPAVTIARTFSDTFAGIQPSSAPMFILCQIIGCLLAVGVMRVTHPK